MREVRASIDSREFSQWQVYERTHGHINGGYSAEMLAQNNELLQVLIDVTLRTTGNKGYDFAPVPRPGVKPPKAKVTTKVDVKSQVAAFEREAGMR